MKERRWVFLNSIFLFFSFRLLGSGPSGIPGSLDGFG